MNGSSSEVIPLPRALAYIIAVLTIPLPSIVYWQYGSSLFGPNAVAKLLALAAIGGAVSFALFAGRRRWSIASFLGLAAGFGASGLHLAYTTIFHKQSMLTSEITVVHVLGAAPAMAILALILQKDDKPKTEPGQGRV